MLSKPRVGTVRSFLLGILGRFGAEPTKTSPIIPEAKVCQRTEKSRSLCRHPSTAAKNRLSIFCPGQGHECKRSGAHEFEEQRTIQTTHSKYVRRRNGGQKRKRERAWGVCNHTNTAGSHIGGNHN